MAALLKPLSHPAATWAEPVTRKPILAPKIVAIPERTVSGEVLNELRVNLPDGEPSQPPHHPEVIPTSADKPSPLVGVVVQAEAKLKLLRHLLVGEGVNL